MEFRENVRLGTLSDACKRYSLGKTNMRARAIEAGAALKVGSKLLINYEKMDRYFDGFQIDQGA